MITQLYDLVPVEDKTSEYDVLIGTSLSMCVVDIMCSRVNINNVACIVTNTKATLGSAEWDTVIETYCRTCWKNNEITARQIVFMLRKTHRIVQPRLTCKVFTASDCSNGHWIRLNQYC